MRKSVLVLASVALAMLLISGAAAWAANVIRCERGSTEDKPCHGTKNPDILRGTIGRDYIVGWSVPSGSRLFGSKDNDTIYGYANNDNIQGGNGNDRLYGGSGDDDIDGGRQTAKIRGEAGDDNLIGGSGGSAWISGGTGNDELTGNFNHPDTLFGGREADRLQGWTGVDHLYGGAGPDLIDAQDFHTDNKDFVTCGEGVDKVFADEEGVDEIAADCEKITYETR